MRMKWVKRIAVGCSFFLVLFCAVAYPYYSGKVNYLFLKPHIDIEVNDVVVPGEVLSRSFNVVATKRDEGKEHSYLLFFAGDIDSEGNEGFAYDCGSWVAPRVPILVETQQYPPCGDFASKHSKPFRYPFKSSRRFKTADNDMIRFRTDKW